MNVNSSTYYSASAGSSSASNGLSGLMSGMDTDSMVEKMLSGTQGKIDKQESIKQQTLWKQEIYRDIITSVNDFYGKFFDPAFDSSLKNNFASASFFNSMVSNVRSGDALKVISANSSALAGEMKIAVKQLATTASLQGKETLSTGKLISGSDLDATKLKSTFEKKVTLKVGGDSVEVNLNNVTSNQGMADAFNQALKDKGLDNSVTAKVVGGSLRFVTSSTSTNVTVDQSRSSELGLRATGLSRPTESPVKDVNDVTVGNMLQGSLAEPEAGYSFAMTLDGVTKNITMNAMAGADGKTITEESVRAAIEKEVKQAFGSYVNVNLETKDGKQHLEFKMAAGYETGHSLTITGADADKIGIAPGATNQVNTSTKLGDLGLQGGQYQFKINGVEFSFDENSSLGSVINTVNNSKAGVKISYSTLSDTFRMEATSSGKEFGIEMEQTQGDFLTKIFGSTNVAQADSVGSKQLTTDTVQGTRGGPGEDYRTTSGTLSMIVNGKTYTYTLEPKQGIEAMLDPNYNADAVQTNFNAWLTKEFGGRISYDMTSGQLEVTDDSVVSFAQTKVDLEDGKAVETAMKYDLGLAFGFTQKAASNVATADTAISEIAQFKGMDLTRFKKSDGTAATTLGEIAQMSGVAITSTTTPTTTTPATVSFANGRLSLSGAAGEIDFSTQAKMADLFGGTKLTLSDGKTPTSGSDIKKGADAIVNVNGVETTRSSNNFTIDGITMELTKESAQKKDADGNPIKDAAGNFVYEETVIGTTRDTDTIVAGFKSFVEDYNKMIDKVTGYLYQDADYRDYAPLTAAQRKEMSESEIENWEKKAKTGLVRNDSTVSAMMSSLRMTLYSKPDGAKFALYNIGLETTDGTKTGGKLKFNEAALRDALASDPDAVRQLFTDSAEGLSKQLMNTMDSVVKTKGATPGTLVQLAGMPNTTSEKTSSMYQKLTKIESQIKDLKAKYEKERTRYWKQFNSMEKIIANYNSQSAYIGQQFGGY